MIREQDLAPVPHPGMASPSGLRPGRIVDYVTDGTDAPWEAGMHRPAMVIACAEGGTVHLSVWMPDGSQVLQSNVLHADPGTGCAESLWGTWHFLERAE